MARMDFPVASSSIAASFDLHRHRFLAPEILRHRIAEAIEGLERDAPNAIGLAMPLLEHAPYNLELHRALASFHLRARDVDGARHHIETCVDLAEVPDLLETLAPPPSVRAATFDAIAEARKGMYTRCRTGELRFTQLEPTFEDFSLVLRWPEAHDERVQEAIDRLALQCGRIESVILGKARDDEQAVLLAPTMESPFQCQRDVYCALPPLGIWGPVGLVLDTLQTIAPWLDDVRFLARVDGQALHECWIVAGCFYLSRNVTPLYRDSVSGMAEYLEPIYRSLHGSDEGLRECLFDLLSQTFPLNLEIWEPAPAPAVRDAERVIARMRDLGEEPGFMIARLERARGNLPATAATLRTLARPGNRLVHLELARVLLECKEYEESLSWAALAAEAAYQDDSRLLAARAAAHLGDEERSHEWLLRYAELRCNASPGVVLREAGALVNLGDFNGARILYEALLTVPRYEARARDGLALCARQ
jgi:hypothetical protein